MKINGTLINNAMAAFFSLTLLSGCVAYGGNGDPRTGRYPSEHVDIPHGHLPPPGECRVWYPDLPPGQQPPPGNCRDLKRKVPPGAILVHG